MNWRSLLLFVSTIWLLTTCTENDVPAPDGSLQETEVERITPSGSETYLSENSDVIFDQGELHTFDITIPESNLRIINADPAAERYVEAALTFQGETISPVGIRYKGSIGAFVNCLSGTDWTNPSGSKVCTKLSMKVKINWLNREDDFYDLKKLQFHAMNLDDSQLRERLGYHLFRQMNIPAPRAVHAKLRINGTYVGLFALVEQIDGKFSNYHFEDGSGNIYKEVWPVNMNGIAVSEQQLLANLKTNEESNPSAALMRQFGLDIQHSTMTDLPSVVEDWMDIDQMISYAVVDRVIRHDDGPFHWYCGEGGCSNHNYYWYEEPTSRSMHLIPWDLDNAFENIVTNVNPVTPIKDKWGEITNECNPFTYGLFQNLQRSAACDKLTAGWVMFDELYQQKRVAFIEGPFSDANTDALIDAWTQQIREATVEASEAHDDALPIEQWEFSVSSLRQSLVAARK